MPGRLATVWRFRHFWLSLVGMDLRLTFRVLHRGGGFYQYVWKAAPTMAH